MYLISCKLEVLFSTAAGIEEIWEANKIEWMEI